MSLVVCPVSVVRISLTKSSALLTHRDEVHSTREKSGFEKSDDQATGHQSGKRLRQALTYGGNAPDDHDDAEECGRSDLLEQKIARYLEEDVCNEEGE